MLDRSRVVIIFGVFLFSLSASPLVWGSRISALEEALQVGNKQAVLESFWDEVRSQNGPIVAQIPNDPNHVSVTFVWRESAPAGGGVTLLSDIDTSPTTFGERMENIPGTDVWFKTLNAIKGGSLFYSFVSKFPVLQNDPNRDHSKPPTQVQREEVDRFFNSQVPDPFNHRLGLFDLQDRPDFYQSVLKSKASSFSANGTQLSVLSLPGASDRPWIQFKNVPHGNIEEYEFPKATVKNDVPTNRKIAIYTPPSFSKERRELYPVVILFDGEDAFREERTPTLLDNLIAENKLDPIVAVFISIENGREDLAASDGYIEFLVQTLMPYLRENFHVSKESNKVMIGGFSLGGMAAAYAGLKRPDVFGNVLSGDRTVPELFKSRKSDFETVGELLPRYYKQDVKYRKAQKFYITYSRVFEELGPLFVPKGYAIKDYKPAFENFAKNLKSHGARAHISRMPIGHNMLHMQIALHDALMMFFGKDHR